MLPHCRTDRAVRRSRTNARDRETTALGSSPLDRRLLRGDDWTGRWEREGENVRQKKVDFGGDKIDDELDWAVRCKGCGELYVLREVGAEKQHSQSRNTLYPLTKRIRSSGFSHKGSVWDITAGSAGVSGRTSSSRAKVTRFMCASAVRPSRRPSVEPSRIRTISSGFSNSRTSPKRM